MSDYSRVSTRELLFGKYRLVERLDGTGIGEPHLAKLVGTEGFEKQVVLWRFDATSQNDPSLIERVMCEAKRAASLSHANIAHVLDLAVLDGVCFVATEHVPGRTLETVVRSKGAVSWPVAAYIGSEVARALSYAHARRDPKGELLRLIHGHLSPGHIALSAAGGVKVTGFGTSAGTLHDWCSLPEEARGEPLDGRADVFALGASLRRCLARVDIPEPLRELIEETMQTYPEQRPSAGQLRRALNRVLHAANQPVRASDVAALAVDPDLKGPSRRECLPPADPAGELGTRGGFLAAIARMEQTLDSLGLASRTDAQAMLHLYERLGRLYVAVHVGERGATAMMRALDLADGLGRDDYATLFCTLQSELLGQANRVDESRDWLERAARFRR